MRKNLFSLLVIVLILGMILSSCIKKEGVSLRNLDSSINGTWYDSREDCLLTFNNGNFEGNLNSRYSIMSKGNYTTNNSIITIKITHFKFDMEQKEWIDVSILEKDSMEKWVKMPELRKEWGYDDIYITDEESVEQFARTIDRSLDRAWGNTKNTLSKTLPYSLSGITLTLSFEGEPKAFTRVN